MTQAAQDSKRPQDPKYQSPAAQRNREPIFEVLSQYLPARARVLELASGSGEHGIYFTQARPGWEWQPSDATPEALASIRAWREEEQAAGRCLKLLAPVLLNATTAWPAEWQGLDAVVAINLIHISPWSVTTALMQQAGERLAEHGRVVLYGPYHRQGMATAPSNLAFDDDLKKRDSAWGLRTLERVEAEAGAYGLELENVIEMPANNLCVVFRRRNS